MSHNTIVGKGNDVTGSSSDITASRRLVSLGYLDHNIHLMRQLGLWPLDTDSRLLLVTSSLFTTLLVVSLAIVSVCQIIEIFVSPNITSMASAVDLATLTSSALFKQVYMIWYHSHFQQLVEKIDATFVQKDFFLGEFDMNVWLRHSRFYINLYVAMAMPSLGFVFGFPPYFMPYYLPQDGLNEAQINDSAINVNPTGLLFEFNQTGQSKFVDMNNNSEEPLDFQNNIDLQPSSPKLQRKFPFNCWIPFDVTWSPVYEIVYLLELLALLGSGQIYLVSDSFFFMMIYMTCGQLELLKASFRGLKERLRVLRKEILSSEEYEEITSRAVGSPMLWNIYSKEKRIENKLDEELIKCIDFHSNIVKTIIDLDSLLRSMVIVDFVHAVISLSFAMLQTITSNTVFEWFQMCIFIAVCILHQFLNNYFAEILRQQQVSVAEAVYETPWVEGTDLHKMAVYMTLNQTNHPIRLSGWRMYHLSLSTFVEFMKLLASYFLVLQSLHANESRRSR